MKASDFAVTASERERAASRLVQTEATDAVNTGIVGSAEPSGERALKGRAKRTRSVGGGPKGPTPPSSPAALASAAKRRRGPGSGQGRGADVPGDATRAQATGHMRAAVAAKGKTGARAAGAARATASSAVHGALRDTELEGADDLYYKGHGVYRVAKGIKRRLARTSADATEKGLGPLSEKGSARKAVRHADARRRVQMSGYFKRSVYATAERAQAAARTASTGARAIASSVGGGLKGAIAAAGGTVAVPVAVLVALLLLLAVIGGFTAGKGASDAASSSASLSATESQVAAFLRGKGLDDLHVAAIMGNMSAESGINPSATEAGGTGIGICQWSYGRASGLKMYAASQGKSWTDLTVQLDFFWDRDIWQSDWKSSYRITQSPVEGDPPIGTRVSGSKTAFLATGDLDDAVRQFCYGWECPGIPRINVRIEAAHRYYAALTSGGVGTGQDYASAEQWQRDIVDAAGRVPSPGAGLCAAWVSNVYAAAGLGYVGGNADDMYYAWCNSSNRADLKVGMIIAVDRYVTSGTAHAGYAPDGRKLSFHVGIYVGDGKVMDNIGSIRTMDLDKWIETYGNYHTVKWGFANR